MNDDTSESTAVLQLITGLGVGGAERVVLELSRCLNDLGTRTVVVSLNDDRRMMGQYANTTIPVYSLGMAKNPLSFMKAAVTLTRFIRRERISVIHAHMFHSLMLALFCNVTTLKCKVVFTSHSTKGFSFLRRLLIRASKSLRAVDVIFFAGQHSEMNTLETVVIPNGVSVDPARKIYIKGEQKKKRIFLSVGRLESVKNPISLVRSFGSMDHKDTELWLVGDGYLRPIIEQEIRILDIEDRVRLLGIRHDVPQLLAQVDCFVMASRWEGLPMAILEAGAVALPVISTPVGAIPALLGDDCGYLVDESELSQALDDVVEDYSEANRRGNRLFEKIVKNFSLEHMSQAHAELYESLLTPVESHEC